MIFLDQDYIYLNLVVPAAKVISLFLYKVSLLESISEVIRSDVVMNPFIFLLICYRPKQSFYINLESD